jgi:hypothetical protein
MSQTNITLPELALVAGTRVLLGAGLGLLLADHFPADQRKGVGWTMLLVGLVTTVPLAFEVLGNNRFAMSGNSKARHSSRTSGDMLVSQFADD